MIAWSEPLFAPDHRPDHRAFEEEGKHSLHSQCLTNNIPGKLRKCRPVRAELKFHWNSSDHANREVYAKDTRPKTCSITVAFIASAQMPPFQKNQNPRQPHRELRK